MTNKLMIEINELSNSLNYQTKLEKHFTIFTQNIDDLQSDFDKFLLGDLLVLAFFAISENASSYLEIEDYGQIMFSFLNQFGIFRQNRIPTENTIRKVLKSIDNSYFENLLSSHLIQAFRCGRTHYVNHYLKEQSSQITDDLISVYDNGKTTILTSSSTDSTIMQILACLDLKNSILTLDTSLMSENVVDYVLAKKGHFLVEIKSNLSLHSAVALYFSKKEQKLKEKSNTYFKQSETRSAQKITKEWFIINCPKLKENSWTGISTLVYLRTTITNSNQEPTIQHLYYASSLASNKYYFLLSDLLGRDQQVVDDFIEIEDEDCLKIEKKKVANIKSLFNFSMILLKLIQSIRTKPNDDKPSIRICRKIIGWGRKNVMTSLFSIYNDDELSKKFKI